MQIDGSDMIGMYFFRDIIELVTFADNISYEHLKHIYNYIDHKNQHSFYINKSFNISACCIMLL